MAGYSGTPLPQKLGIKPGARVGLWKAPPELQAALGALPEGVVLEDTAAKGGARAYDVMVAFVTAAADVAPLFTRLRKRLDPAGGLWIGWPKKKNAAGISTDVNENLVRDVGLSTGLVDNKVCAIDDTWSGLRFVVRLTDRPAPRRR
jgi:hypothetical protein